MITPAMMLFAGSVVVVISLVGFIAALVVRPWFFTPDVRLEPRPALVRLPVRREIRAAPQLAPKEQCAPVPEGHVAQHRGDAPVFVDHRPQLQVAQPGNKRPQPLELTAVRLHVGAVHRDQLNRVPRSTSTRAHLLGPGRAWARG